MLSYFPELLYLAPFSAFVIRITVAIVLGMIAYRGLRAGSLWERGSALVSGLAALFLFAGALTQPMALIASLTVIESLVRSEKPFPKSTLWLALIMSLSLVITGAGPFAFDLPL